MNWAGVVVVDAFLIALIVQAIVSFLFRARKRHNRCGDQRSLLFAATRHLTHLGSFRGLHGGWGIQYNLLNKKRLRFVTD